MSPYLRFDLSQRLDWESIRRQQLTGIHAPSLPPLADPFFCDGDTSRFRHRRLGRHVNPLSDRGLLSRGPRAEPRESTREEMRRNLGFTKAEGSADPDLRCRGVNLCETVAGSDEQAIARHLRSH